MHSTKGCFALAFASIALVAGCGQSRQTGQASTDAAAVAPAVPAPEPSATSVPAWVAELRQGEAALGQTVEQGRLGEVHAQAIQLQTLLKQAAGQAGNLTPEYQQMVTEHLGAADRVVNDLHDAGDSGDLMKAKAKFQEFQTHLRAIEGAFGVSTP